MSNWFGRECSCPCKSSPPPVPEPKRPPTGCTLYGYHKANWGPTEEKDFNGVKKWVQLGVCADCGISEFREVHVQPPEKLKVV